MSVLVTVKTASHDGARLLHLQSRLWPISGEVRQLPCIHRATSLPANNRTQVHRRLNSHFPDKPGQLVSTLILRMTGAKTVV